MVVVVVGAKCPIHHVKGRGVVREWEMSGGIRPSGKCPDPKT